MSSDRNRTPRSNRENRTGKTSGSSGTPSGGASSSRRPSGSSSGSRSTRGETPAAAPGSTPASPSLSAVGRKRAEERIKEREQEKRRQQIITAVVIVAVLVGVALLAVVLRNAPVDAPLLAGAAVRYDGLAADRTEDGYPRLGNSAVPIEVLYYTSFDCDSCAAFHNNIIQGLVDRVRGGGIKLVEVTMAGTGTFTNGRGASVAAICVAEQDPSAFWEFQDTLFAWQTQFASQAYTDPRLRAGAEQLGADINAWYGCVNSGRPSGILTQAATEARALANYTTTPTIAINGIVPLGENNTPLIEPEAILARIDEEIARLQRPVTPAPEATAEATAEATTEPAVEATAEATVSP
ncbi:MAG: thioredoxin domain-containing protein [Anaerolineae bacterium]